MKRSLVSKYIVVFLSALTILLSGTLSGGEMSAATSLLPLARTNLKYRTFNEYQANYNAYYRTPSKSWLYPTDSGYVRVFFENRYYTDDSGDPMVIAIEEYDNDFNVLSRKTVNGELTRFGGFYAGKDNFFLVFGANNPNDIEETEVIRIVKYGKDWKRISSASVYSKDSNDPIKTPFDDHGFSMFETNDKLYIATSRRGWGGHTGYLMVQVDKNNMTAAEVDNDLGHSFAQYLAAYDKDNMYVLEESEGRYATILSKFSETDPQRDNVSYGNQTPYDRNTAVRVLQYKNRRNGSAACETYASADALAVAGTNIISVGTSADQDKYQEYNDDTLTPTYNIYLSVTPVQGFGESNTTLKWMTNDGKVARGSAKLVKINNNRFLLMWLTTDVNKDYSGSDYLQAGKICYEFIDGSGNVISKKYTAKATLSECEPILKDGKVVFYSSTAVNTDFYTIDASYGSFSAKSYNIAGESVVWDYKDGMLTLSGKGKVMNDFSSHIGYLQEKIKAVNVENGIEEIGSYAFYNMRVLSKITFPKTLKTYPEDAFGNCNMLSTLIFDSMTAPKGPSYHIWGCVYVPEGAAGFDSGGWAGQNVFYYKQTPDVKIDSKNFPDAVFRQYIKRNCDWDDDGFASSVERCKMTSVSFLPDEVISDLKGIETLYNLETLYCKRLGLKKLDVSKNTLLWMLDCSENQLTSLDLSQNSALTYVNCSDNKIRSLDVSKNTKLNNLYCEKNKLSSLVLGKKTGLYMLQCYLNDLADLDISKCPYLVQAFNDGRKMVLSNEGGKEQLRYAFYESGIVKYMLAADNITSVKDMTDNSNVSVRLDASDKSVACGSYTALKVTVEGSSSRVVWSSSDNTIASVSDYGYITGRKAGSVTVSAAVSGKKSTCRVTVLYRDVTDPKDFWYEPTNYLTAKNVVKGYADQTEFRPANDCTRAQMVTFLYRLQGEPKTKATTCQFTDVKKSDYFYKPVIWAVENGITTGVSKTSFKPQGACTRAQTVTFLWRMANKPEPSGGTRFPDVKKSDYFYKATLWASEKKILAGLPDGTFNPQGKCLRRQMVTFLYKYDKYVNKKA